MTLTAAVPTRRTVVDAVLEAYFELYVHLNEDMKRRRAVQRAFQRGRDMLTMAATWPDARIGPDIAVAVSHLLRSAPSSDDAPDAVLGWLDLLPSRVVSYVEPERYELVFEEREAVVQTGLEAAFVEWRTSKARDYWETRLTSEGEPTPAGRPRSLVAA